MIHSNGIKINGSVNVIRPNIRVFNGVIHVVDKVISIPTVVTHAVANPNFTSLVAALTRQGNTTDFVSVLSSNGPFTVFAPTNDAFGSLLTELNTTFGAIPEPVLDKVLKYHVVAGNVRSTDLPASGSVIPTIAGNTPGTSFTLLTSPTIRLKDANNRECPIIATDVQASNGVIHVLSRVLLPN
ncbi:MAG: fasciclin domain-containing protein [Flavobacterium sp.]|nr:fasciclin domain-containing protein [Flavobacterium sp.]